MKHSGLGIASFALSIITGLLIFVTILVAGALEHLTPGGMGDRSLTATMIGFAIIGFCALTAVALALGVASLFQKERQKVFGILGTVLSSVIILGTAVLVAVGMSMK